MTQQEIEYHLKMLADTVSMLTCMIQVPTYEGADDPEEAKKWFADKLELMHYRCSAIINHK